jgi:hypothetical protein
MPKLFTQLQRSFRPEIANGRRDFLAQAIAEADGILVR